MANKVYARVRDGVVTEYPVYDIHIKNRAHPFEWYTPVVYQAKPEFDPRIEGLKEIMEVFENQVLVRYEVVERDINSILQDIHYPPNGERDPNDPFHRPKKVEVNIADVDPVLIEKIRKLAADIVLDKLDKFAQEKGYDDIRSCVSYTASTNPKFKAEADIAIAKRDQAWTNLYTYLDEVVAGTKPVPESWADIEANLPEFTWPS